MKVNNLSQIYQVIKLKRKGKNKRKEKIENNKSNEAMKEGK